MSYIDGFVAAVPTANREAYRAYSSKAAPAFKAQGATSYYECWGDEVPDGKVTSFPMAVKLRPDETVVFAWIVWPSKAVRDQGMANIMKDPQFDTKTNPMPFDGQRLIYGGFVPIVEA